MAIKASMNNGLSEELKAAFPNTIPVQRPKVMGGVIKDPRWVAGFVDAFRLRIHLLRIPFSSVYIELRHEPFTHY